MSYSTLPHAITAMHAGRLDEALTLLTDPAVRPHKKAQDALTRLRHQLVDRGRAHLDAGRTADARQDARRALAITPGDPDAAGLINDVRRTESQRRVDQQRAQDQLVQAQKLAGLGHSQHARQALAADPDAPAPRRLLQHLDLRKLERQTLIERAETALARDDLHAALRAVEGLAAFPPAAATDTLRHTAASRTAQAAHDHLHAGQTAAAAELITQAGPLADTPPLHPPARACDALNRAARALQTGDANAALPCLQQAAATLPDARWLQQAIDQTRALRDTREALTAGPLAGLNPNPADETPPLGPTRLRATRRATRRTIRRATPPPVAWTGVPTAFRPPNPPVPTAPLVLHRDGQPLAVVAAASRVVLTPNRDRALSDAPAAGQALPLLPHATPPLTLARDEEGHLAAAPEGPAAEHRAASPTVLAHGARLSLGPRLRLRYHRASPASQTAVLEITAGRLVPPHLRKIVLLAGELLVGPHRGCHLRQADLPDALTLRPADGGLTTNGLVLLPGDTPTPIAGHTWSVTPLDTASA